MGKISTAKSVTMPTTLEMMDRVAALTHFAPGWSVGSQPAATGMHGKMATTCVAMHHATTTDPTPQSHRRNTT